MDVKLVAKLIMIDMSDSGIDTVEGASMLNIITKQYLSNNQIVHNDQDINNIVNELISIFENMDSDASTSSQEEVSNFKANDFLGWTKEPATSASSGFGANDHSVISDFLDVTEDIMYELTDLIESMYAKRFGELVLKVQDSNNISALNDHDYNEALSRFNALSSAYLAYIAPQVFNSLCLPSNQGHQCSC